MQVWRICKERFQEAAFTGEGARLYSGRWNPAGVRMVYTSASLALAAIELFVHLGPENAPEDMVSTSAEWSEQSGFMETIRVDRLPTDWRSPEHSGLRQLSAEWIASGRSVALMVPSVAVEGEWNVLLNPAHPGFAKVHLHPPRPFHFDQRMFKIAPDPAK